MLEVSRKAVESIGKADGDRPVIDWKRISDLNHSADVFSLSEDTLALCVSLVTSSPFRGQWVYDGQPVTDSEWDEIQSAVAIAYEQLCDPYICPPSGGDMGYELISDITLSVDTTTLTLDNLDLIAGRDLVIELVAQNNSNSRRALKIIVNGNTTGVYDQLRTEFETSTTLSSTNSGNNFILDNAIQDPSDDGDEWSYITLDLPLWKLTDRYPKIRARWDGRNHIGLAECAYKVAEAISELQISSTNSDLLAGTKIAVYARGA